MKSKKILYPYNYEVIMPNQQDSVFTEWRVPTKKDLEELEKYLKQPNK
jgi:hypothetical protein